MSFLQEVQFREQDELPAVRKKLRLLVEEMVRLSNKRSSGDSTTVQAALDSLAAVDADLQAQIDAISGGGGGADWNDITGRPSTFPPEAHTHAASEVTYDNASSGLTSTNVQLALDEVVTLIGTGGISGLDDIPGVDTPTPIIGDVLYFDGVNWINQAGAGGYTDEEAQDAVGGILISSATVTLTYDDGGPGITADVNTSDALDVLGTPAQGQIAYRNATDWVLLDPGTDGDVLTTHGAAADPTWETPSGGSAIALPGTIPDLQLWWESDDVLASSGVGIIALRDRTPWMSGTRIQASTGVGPEGSGSTLNSLPVVSFPGASTGRTLFSGILLAKCTIFAVMRPAAIGADRTITNGGSNNGLQFRIETSGALGLLQSGVAFVGTSTSNLSAATWYQVNVAYDSSSGAYAFRINSVAAGSGTQARTINVLNTSFGWSPADAGQDFSGLFAAFIVYNRVLSGPEIASVEAYITAKWSV